jgi:hypothetical protein
MGEVARKGITAGTTRGKGVGSGPRSDILLLLEGAVEDVDAEVGVVSAVATGELDALRLWERGGAVAGNDEVGAHGVELTAAHQDDISG